MNKFQKVALPGEWPWVLVLDKTEDRLVGRLDNTTTSTQHNYRLNDVLEFRKVEVGGSFYWDVVGKFSLEVLK
jgi:hypothetical protein